MTYHLIPIGSNADSLCSSRVAVRSGSVGDWGVSPTFPSPAIPRGTSLLRGVRVNHDTTNDDLGPLTPGTAVGLFREQKAVNRTEATVRNHRNRVKHFLEWGNGEEIEDLNEVSGRDIQQYRLWLGDKDDLSALTLELQLSGFSRSMIQLAGSAEAVPENRYTKLMIP